MLPFHWGLWFSEGQSCHLFFGANERAEVELQISAQILALLVPGIIFLSESLMSDISYVLPLGPLPVRNAYRVQCVWTKLDDAVNMCPTLRQISTTSIFQDELKLFVEQCNEYMKEKNISGSVKTTVLNISE